MNVDHSDGLEVLEPAGRHGEALSQQHPLQAVRRNAVLVLGVRVALRVGAARRRALRGAQVVHERQPVLPAEVHELDLAHARVEVDACREQRRELVEVSSLYFHHCHCWIVTGAGLKLKQAGQVKRTLSMDKLRRHNEHN